MAKYRYDIINPRTGVQQEWTGRFNKESDADEWYKTYGKQWEKEGKELVKVKCCI